MKRVLQMQISPENMEFFGMVLEMAKIPMGFGMAIFSQPPEALRQVPLAGTASLVGAIPMRPLTWTKGVGRSNDKSTRLFRCFFSLESPRNLVPCNHLFSIFIHEPLSSQRLGFL